MGAPTQNPNDGTQLGTSEIISDEYIDPILGCRVINTLPGTPYKLPRSKIAVGPYGQDGGDATPDTPLYTESLRERQFAEKANMIARDVGVAAIVSKYKSETVPLFDQRGHHLTHRGQR